MQALRRYVVAIAAGVMQHLPNTIRAIKYRGSLVQAFLSPAESLQDFLRATLARNPAMANKYKLVVMMTNEL